VQRGLARPAAKAALATQTKVVRSALEGNEVRQRTCHMYDSYGQVLALAFWKTFSVAPSSLGSGSVNSCYVFSV